MKRRELVKEAVTLINKSGGDYDKAAYVFKSHGWKYLGGGVHKIGFRKGNVIAKVGHTDSDREAIKSLRASGLYRHYAKIYYISNIGVVQRAVTPYYKLNGVTKSQLRERVDEIVALADQLGYSLSDLHTGNIGTLGGALKVFDCFCEPLHRCDCARCREERGE